MAEACANCLTEVWLKGDRLKTSRIDEVLPSCFENSWYAANCRSKPSASAATSSCPSKAAMETGSPRQSHKHLRRRAATKCMQASASKDAQSSWISNTPSASMSRFVPGVKIRQNYKAPRSDILFMMSHKCLTKPSCTEFTTHRSAPSAVRKHLLCSPCQSSTTSDAQKTMRTITLLV